jgi:hypothetical protein
MVLLEKPLFGEAFFNSFAALLSNAKRVVS